MKGVSILLTQDRNTFVPKGNWFHIIKLMIEKYCPQLKPVEIRVAPLYQMLSGVILGWISNGKGWRKQKCAIRSWRMNVVEQVLLVISPFLTPIAFLQCKVKHFKKCTRV